MKRFDLDGPFMRERANGDYVLYEDMEEVLKRQAAAALSGMNAAKAISSGQLQQAHRLNRESSPEALESERSANDLLTEENERLRNGVRNCLLLAMKRLHKGSYEVADWEHVIRFCNDAGEGPSITRATDS